MKILFVLPRMAFGGVERVTLNLIREFQKTGHQCVLALRRAHGDLLEEALSTVEVHELAPAGLHQFIPALVVLVRHTKPTHVVTAFADIALLTWLAMRIARSPARWVHGVHNTHSPVIARAGAWGKLRHWLDMNCAGFVYRRADALVAVSNGVRAEVVNRFRITPQRVSTIYNPVVPETELHVTRRIERSPRQPFTIVAMGRLSRQKGFDILVDAMQKVPQPWQLDIWGEGEERGTLQARIDSHGLQDFIRLCGYTPDPYTVLRDADLFVLSSRHEGLPTVLVEALACQCQIISTDCPHGPREILLDGVLGRLVTAEDPNRLAQSIGAAVLGTETPIEASLLLSRASEFTLETATKKWSALLQRK